LRKRLSRPGEGGGGGVVGLPSAGVVVLDFSQFLAGPVAALRLADLGARVVKVERPVTGEIGRTLAFAGRWADEDTVSFHAMNRNKEAVVADLKDPGELELVRRLVARADVLIHNFRPGVMERLGLDYESVRALNPGLVYAAASGYGADGPWADRPGQDLLAQSVSARSREIGLRIALGATAQSVVTMVMARGLVLTTIGVVLGAFVAWMLTRAMQTLLFGVNAGDPLTFAVVLGLLATVAVIACAIPAIRAARVDPMLVLRDQ